MPCATVCSDDRYSIVTNSPSYQNSTDMCMNKIRTYVPNRMVDNHTILGQRKFPEKAIFAYNFFLAQCNMHRTITETTFNRIDMAKAMENEQNLVQVRICSWQKTLVVTLKDWH